MEMILKLNKTPVYRDIMDEINFMTTALHNMLVNEKGELNIGAASVTKFKEYIELRKSHLFMGVCDWLFRHAENDISFNTDRNRLYMTRNVIELFRLIHSISPTMLLKNGRPYGLAKAKKAKTLEGCGIWYDIDLAKRIGGLDVYVKLQK